MSERHGIEQQDAVLPGNHLSKTERAETSRWESSSCLEIILSTIEEKYYQKKKKRSAIEYSQVEIKSPEIQV